jgi:DNA invertase Pin-like site-specific DNA recombinase
VSAYKVGPFARKELGDWLTYRKSDFDIAAWARQDRAIRNMADMSDLVRWARTERKMLVFVKGPGGGAMVLEMKLGPFGEFIAQVYAFAAQAEAQADSERVAETHAWLRSNGQYGGGWVPFGYRPEPKAGKGYELEPDPEYVPILQRMVADTIAGKGPTAIADWLNAEGIPTSKDVLRIRTDKPAEGLRWRYPSVIGILRSRAMCGLTEFDGEIVYADDGLPVRFTHDPIVSDHDWRKVQQALDGMARPVQVQRKDSPWLTGVTFCEACDSPLYSKRQRNRGKTYNYMVCYGVRQGECQSSKQFRRDTIEARIDAWFTEHGSYPFVDQRTIQGSDHADEIATVTDSIKDLAGKAELADVLKPKEAEDIRAKVAVLKTRLGNLVKMPNEPDRIVTIQTGETVAQHWAKLSRAGQRALLVSRGARVIVSPDGSVNVEPGSLVLGLPVRQCEGS